MNIREITQGHDRQTYQTLCKYCFPNPNNWIDNLFPLPPHDHIFGVFQGDTLQAGLIAKAFTTYLFTQKITMDGIGAVVSAPEGRNAGHVRELLKHALQYELERGALISSLYPFLFQFYEKMGYGYIGGAVSYTFKPDDLREFTIQGAWQPVVSPVQSAALAQIHNQFVRGYDFGTEVNFDIQTHHEHLKKFDAQAYIYHHQDATQAYIEYRLIPGDPFTKKMHVGRFGYADAASLQAVLGFIRAHRNQCSEVMVLAPDNVELRPMFKEPRVKTERFAHWMARPLDVEAVLRLRVAQAPCANEITLSIRDPLLEQNTGTYRLHGVDVIKTPYTDVHPIVFPVFSSLLFKAVTFEQAYAAGRIGWYDENVSDYFSKIGDIYLSAAF